MLDPG